MGIVNVTPDSFSDGGLYACPDKAAEFAHDMVRAGAEIIDIGGQSSRPGAQPVSAEEELARVLPVIERLRNQLPGSVALSIDTYYPEVAEAACAAGANIINDISGFRNPKMIAVAVAAGAECVLMHMAGEPRTMQDNPHYDDVVAEVKDYLLKGAARLEAAGIPASRIILDPGFGFGKTKEHNLQLCLHMDELVRDIHAADYRLLVGISRKSLLDDLFGIKEPRQRDNASAELADAFVLSGADIVRTHRPDLSDVMEGRRRDAFVALGSNMNSKAGGPLDNVAAALVAMDRLPHTVVTYIATAVISEPAYDSDQEPFANAVCYIETELGPHALFAYLRAIEADMGREKTRVNGPRIIDLDLLLYSDVEIDLPLLTVPHPRICERAFVLEPLLELKEVVEQAGRDFVLPDNFELVPTDVVYGAISARIPRELLQSKIAEIASMRGPS